MVNIKMVSNLATTANHLSSTISVMITLCITVAVIVHYRSPEVFMRILFDRAEANGIRKLDSHQRTHSKLRLTRSRGKVSNKRFPS